MKVNCDVEGGCGRTYVAKMWEKPVGAVDLDERLPLDDFTTGVVQYMQCPYCRIVVPIAHITDAGLTHRKRIEKRRRQKKPISDELLAEYNEELTPLR